MNRDWTPSHWQEGFAELLDSDLDQEDQWTLNFNYKQTYSISPDERRSGWKVYKHWAYGRFSCVQCSRKWNSHHVVLLFLYRLRSVQERGTVTMRPYGQACSHCQGPALRYQLPGFTQRQVRSALDRLLDQIRRNCYHQDHADAAGGAMDERPTVRRHQNDLCEGCREGICAGPVKTFDWVVCSQGYAQAHTIQQKKDYVVSSLSVSDQERSQIETDTVGQITNHLWWEYRKNRITSSNFGSVLKAVERGPPYHPSLFKTLRGQYQGQSKAMRWGQHWESRAKQEYTQRTGRVIRDRGLFLSPSGLLGASPDGTVDGGRSLVEVKCPWTARGMSVRQAAQQLRDFCLEVDESRHLRLRADHPYWHQIQGSLALTGASCCDLVVWTPVDMEVLTVHRDPTWAENIRRLEAFYTDVFLTHLLAEV